MHLSMQNERFCLLSIAHFYGEPGQQPHIKKVPVRQGAVLDRAPQMSITPVDEQPRADHSTGMVGTGSWRRYFGCVADLAGERGLVVGRTGVEEVFDESGLVQGEQVDGF